MTLVGGERGDAMEEMERNKRTDVKTLLKCILVLG